MVSIISTIIPCVYRIHAFVLNLLLPITMTHRMQTIFLLYHYFHGVELYNPIRVMITCYVWMTGFGHFSFFYTRQDYSAVRVLHMLWRLNFLVICLCLSQGTEHTTYILYYICALHTFGFAIVYITMRIQPKHNYTWWGIRIKLFVLATIIWLVWDVDSGIFSFVHGMFLSNQPIIGASSGSLWEWYFRSSLDHWSTLWGMIFALNYPVASMWLTKVETLPWVRSIAVKTLVASGLVIASICWIVGPFRKEKHLYNQTHAYFGIIPLLTYVFLRNLTPWLRSHSFHLLQQLGQTTLETYLMQHHIWMTSHSQTILTLVPGYPQVNFLLVTLLYVSLSRSLFRMTLVLRRLLLPNNDLRACLINITGLVTSFVLCYVSIVALRDTGLLNAVTLGLATVLLGAILYFMVVQCAWSSSLSSEGDGSANSAVSWCLQSKLGQGISKSTSLPFLSSIIVLVSIGTCWEWMAQHGASRLQPLPLTCAEAVQTGSWAPVDLCTEQTKGQVYRQYDLSSLGTCIPSSPTYVWGWKAPPPSSHCRIHQRDSALIRKSLAGRTITFVGDSILRHLYHSTCRQVGDSMAGAYNTSMGKWGNFSRQYDSLDLEFRWAPYTNDTLVPTLRSLLEDEEVLPDAVVVGGGAWDQLHRNRNENDKNILVEGIRETANQLQRLRNAGVAITWVVPTTINTWGLLTEEKREWLREDQMVELRSLYKKNGIHDAADFVFDGTTFTKERVAYSYDGVHYPLEIYDAGAQIILNSFDWLLPLDEDQGLTSSSQTNARPGSMAHPLYGLVVIFFIAICLLLMDAFGGLSYLASLLLAPESTPAALHYLAYSSLHQRNNLPQVLGEVPTFARSNSKKRNGGIGLKNSEDGEEMVQLMES